MNLSYKFCNNIQLYETIKLDNGSNELKSSSDLSEFIKYSLYVDTECIDEIVLSINGYTISRLSRQLLFIIKTLANESHVNIPWPAIYSIESNINLKIKSRIQIILKFY